MKLHRDGSGSPTSLLRHFGHIFTWHGAGAQYLLQGLRLPKKLSSATEFQKDKNTELSVGLDLIKGSYSSFQLLP